MKKNAKALTNFLFELGMFKKFEHCGTKFAGIKHPDTLGEHTCRAAQIGYALAMAENANPEKVAMMCLFHDIGEIRIGDAHRISKRYIDTAAGEKTAVLEQTRDLPEDLKGRILSLWNEFDEAKTHDGQVARDADFLETILQAKEYLDTGYKAAERWLENGSTYLKTESAKKLFKEIQETHFSDWWDPLNRP